jgi:thiol:disulfide interchange protein DsbC
MISKILTAAAVMLVLVAGFARADVAEVKKAILERFQKLTPDAVTVTKTQHLGLYEVYTSDKQLFYTDENVSYVFFGELIEAKSMKNLTEERMRVLTAIKFDSLPLDLALKTVKGNGKRRFAVFSDPDCPYCRRLEKELANVNDVTIYTFLYPIASLHPAAPERSRGIWCSADRVKAWDDYMLRNTAPDAKGCDVTGLDTVQKVGEKHKINGTPTLIFADGRVVPGALSADQLEKQFTKVDEQKIAK